MHAGREESVKASLHNFFTPPAYPGAERRAAIRITRHAILLAGFLLGAALGAPADATLLPNGDLRIPKAEVGSTARFYPYSLDGVRMEVLAVRAPDGTVRTAFNTCQVCYASGRGWFVQEGDELVCQNCHSRFKLSQVELVKGGCNPLPITADLKKEDAGWITISRQLFIQAKPFFLKWKKRPV
jgi:uncharacterized membrane protein